MASQRAVDVQVQAFDLPLEEPFRIAYDTMTHAHNVLVRLQGPAGMAFGEGAPVPTINGESQQDALDDIANATLGASTPHTVSGRCAIDTAQWDLKARLDGVPLCTALTGARPRPVETSITIPLVADEALDALVARRLSQGFSSFKVKAGLDVDDDIARLRRIRQAIGDRELRVDANQGWSRAAAQRALVPLAEMEVSVLEQPLVKTDLEGHAALRRQSAGHEGPPIMLDESVFDCGDAQRAITAGAADWINIKLQKSGGLTEALKIADFAADNDVPCMVGCMLESRVGILYGAHLAAAHQNIQKADLDGAFLLREDLVDGGGVYEGGQIVLDGSPGIGVAAVRGATA